MSTFTAGNGPSPKAFFVVPMVGALFIDFVNAFIITVFLQFFAYPPAAAAAGLPRVPDFSQCRIKNKAQPPLRTQGLTALRQRVGPHSRSSG